MDRVKKVIRMVLLSAVLTALASDVGFAWLTTRSMTGPTPQVTKGRKEVAEGDGVLTKWLNTGYKNAVGEPAKSAARLNTRLNCSNFRKIAEKPLSAAKVGLVNGTGRPD